MERGCNDLIQEWQEGARRTNVRPTWKSKTKTFPWAAITQLRKVRRPFSRSVGWLAGRPAGRPALPTYRTYLEDGGRSGME